MPAAKAAAMQQHAPAVTTPAVEADDSPAHRRLVKVYLPTEAEKQAFHEEAASHNFNASEYGRFILQARKDPLMFLHLCRLRDPGFAHGLLGKPTEAGRVAELERDNLALAHEKAELERERAELARRCEELEKQLAEATTQTQELAGRVLALSRAQEENREEAVRRGTPYRATDKATFCVVKALSVGGRPTRKELEGRLVKDEGMTPDEASRAIAGASRVGLIVLSPGGRYILAKPAEVEAE